MHVIAISYAKHALEKGSREHERMKKYAAHLDSYTIIVFTCTKDGFSEPVTDGNLVVHPTASKSKIGMLYDAYRIAKHIVWAHPDTQYVVTSQDPFESSIVGLFLKRYSNVVHHVQVHGGLLPAWQKESLLNRLRYHFGLYVLRRTTAVRVVSHRLQKFLVERGVREECIAVLPIRVELDAFLKTAREEKIAEDPITILSLGRLSPEKNIELVIESVAQLVRKHANLELRIVGEGREEERLQELVAEKNLIHHVSFLPWTNSVPEEMAKADIFALASHHEGYALVLVEAMAAGLPVVTTDVGCAGEVFLHNTHGLVVPVEDSRAFGDALDTLITNPELRRRYGSNGRASAETFSQTTEEEYITAWVAALSPATRRL